MKKVTYQVYLNKDLEEEIKLAAKIDNRSVSSLTAYLLKKYLRKQGVEI